MAQLPPKVPSMASNLPGLSSNLPHHHKMPSIENLNTSHSHSWVDDYLNFNSSSKRKSHRRSASDSIAFLEQVSVDLEEGCKAKSLVPRSGTSHAAVAAQEFDQFDEEQFMAMFTDDEAADLTVACSSPSSSSRHNSMEDDLNKSCTTTSTDQQVQLGNGFKSESALDGQYAVGDGVATCEICNSLYLVLESKAEISMLSPRVAFLDHQRLVLNVDNSVLRQRIAALSQDKIFKDGHQEALRREIERLRQVHNYQQNVKKTDDDDTAPPLAESLIPTLPEKITEHPNCSSFSDQIMIR